MKTNGIIFIAFLALLLHDASCVKLPLADPILANYTLVKPLGKGTYGEVVLATDKRNGNEVAIKILDKSKPAPVPLVNEGRIMRKLQHQYIIELIEELETNEKIYLVMEYASRGNLFDYVNDKNKLMKEDEARTKFRQIFLAIDYCHEMKIAHRDLKPENLLLDSNGNIKVTDFGVATELEPGKKLNLYCGNPNFMAPEVKENLKGNLPYDGDKADVWSLGVVLYVMMNKQLPFTENGVYRHSFDMPEKCQQFVKQFFERDPSKRPTLRQIIEKPNNWLNIEK